MIPSTPSSFIFPQQQKIPAYKPLLSELIDSTDWYARTKGRDILYNIELKTNPANDGTKHPPVEEFVDLVMEVVRSRKLESRCYLQSFDFRPLQILHRKYPEIVTAVLIGGNEKRPLTEQLKALGYTPEMYSPHYSLVTPALVRECHEKNIRGLVTYNNLFISNYFKYGFRIEAQCWYPVALRCRPSVVYFLSIFPSWFKK